MATLLKSFYRLTRLWKMQSAVCSSDMGENGSACCHIFADSGSKKMHPMQSTSTQLIYVILESN